MTSDSERWEIQTLTNDPLRPLDVKEIAQGLRSGWLTLEDQIHEGPGLGVPIWRALSNKDFTIEAFTSSIRAHAKIFAKMGAGLVGLLWVVSAFVTTGMTTLNLGLGRAVLLSFGLLVFFAGVAAGLAAFPAGLIVVAILWFVGLPALAALIGVQPLQITDSYFNLGTLLLMGIAAATGGAIGGVGGGVVGSVVGVLRRSRYRSPGIRHPVPDWAKALPSADAGARQEQSSV